MGLGQNLQRMAAIAEACDINFEWLATGKGDKSEITIYQKSKKGKCDIWKTSQGGPTLMKKVILN